jgi:hypothetical protein
LIKRQAVTGLGVSHHGGGSEDAGDRQLGHPLQNSPPPTPSPIAAKAGEITTIMITTPNTSFFMALSLPRRLFIRFSDDRWLLVLVLFNVFILVVVVIIIWVSWRRPAVHDRLHA